jgi:hypothetical protein
VTMYGPCPGLNLISILKKLIFCHWPIANQLIGIPIQLTTLKWWKPSMAISMLKWVIDSEDSIVDISDNRHNGNVVIFKVGEMPFTYQCIRNNLIL